MPTIASTASVKHACPLLHRPRIRLYVRHGLKVVASTVAPYEYHISIDDSISYFPSFFILIFLAEDGHYWLFLYCTSVCSRVHIRSAIIFWSAVHDWLIPSRVVSHTPVRQGNLERKASYSSAKSKTHSDELVRSVLYYCVLVPAVYTKYTILYYRTLIILGPSDNVESQHPTIFREQTNLKLQNSTSSQE